ncbi:MAG: hypothetical protein R3Y56_02260 [Akkermansia sp.]
MSAQNQFNYPIYDFAIGWFNRQNADVIDFIAPALSVDGVTGTIKKYPQGYAFRVADTRRSKGQEANSIDCGAIDMPFLLEDHMLRSGIDDSEIKPGAGNKQEAADQIAQSRIKSLLSVWNTSKIKQCLDIFRAGVPASSGGNWSAASSDPIEELKSMITAYAQTNGVKPNRIMMSDASWDILSENAAVLDRVAFNAAQALTEELLLKLLNLPNCQIMVTTVPAGTAAPGPETSFVGSCLLGSDFWMSYVDEEGGLFDMSGLRMLHMGGDSPVESVESYYERPKHTTWYEVGMHRQAYVTAAPLVKRLSIS